MIPPKTYLDKQLTRSWDAWVPVQYWHLKWIVGSYPDLLHSGRHWWHLACPPPHGNGPVSHLQLWRSIRLWNKSLSPWTIWSYQLIHLCLKILDTWHVYCCLSVTAGKELCIQHNIRCWIWFICLTISCMMCTWTARLWPYDLFTAKSHLFCSAGQWYCIRHNRTSIEFMSV